MKENFLEIQDIAPYINDEFQSLIILPTERCNFRCYYCYEDYQNGEMSLDTVNSLKKFLDIKSKYIKALRIFWFGGEPLIASDIVLDISRYAFELSRKYNFAFEANITTNGYNLTSDLFCKLCQVGVSSYQITLDGPQNIHDKTRILSNGNGTFVTIWNNLKRIHDSKENVVVLLRLHFDEENLPYIYELIEKINIEFKGDNRFKIFFKPISHWGGKNDVKFKVMSREKADYIIKQLNSMFDKEKIYSPNITSCYASHPNNLVIRSTGEISKCTIALSDPQNNIGKINSDGTLCIDGAKFQYWVSGLVNRNRDIALCPNFRNKFIETEMIQ